MMALIEKTSQSTKVDKFLKQKRERDKKKKEVEAEVSLLRDKLLSAIKERGIDIT